MVFLSHHLDWIPRSLRVRMCRLPKVYLLNTTSDSMVETLTALYQRNEVFWVGLSAVILGVLIPEALAFGGINLSELFVVTGSGLLITSIFVGLYRLLAST